VNVFGLFEFYTPEALWLLLLLPAWWIWRRLRRKDAIVFSRTSVLASGPRSGSWIPRAIFLLRNLALASFIVALARPRSGAHTETQTSEGINIVLAIDLSSSMLALDFKPNNRLEVAKEKVKQFIARRTSDRIGIVAFSGEALTQVPLTTDYPVVLAAVDNLHLLNTLDLSLNLDKDSYEKQLEKHSGRLNLLTRNPKFKRKSVVIVFEGNDAAGKGGAVEAERGAVPQDALLAGRKGQRAGRHASRFHIGIEPACADQSIELLAFADAAADAAQMHGADAGRGFQ